ncbi:ABC transporter ATP-binding protein [Pediococcus argentinicus]|nr:ATP-binding cassette domain-containing protein [Pediococcus argentinicus]NKZ23056.1 ATP-binding cassette domain-containing protein [Pediococcus argentinicus]GEP20138.1 ABC transporter ATP-binding protein [Pediococcus argentinicus]
MNNNSVLNMDGVQKVFFPGTANQRHILKNINLNINQGDFISVIGNNGAGKSTLLNTVAGTLIADAGTIEIAGNDITKKPVAGRSKWISRVFQDPKLGTAGDLTVEQNLSIAINRKRHFNLTWFKSKSERNHFKEVLAKLDMGLENRLDTQAKYLSGGQRQVLSLIMATLSKPNLLLLDEHTAALDPKTSEAVMKLTNQIIKENNLTVLMITHKMEDALKYGNRLLMLQDGEIKVNVSGDEKQQLEESDLMEMFES